MKLIYLLIYLVLISQTVRISVAQYLLPVSKKLHILCVQNSPPDIKNVEILNALVCGESFNNYSLNTLFITVGLIHIFVVSGSHLNKIYEVINIPAQIIQPETKVMMNFFLVVFQISLLSLYCLICNLNPPVTRSLIMLVFLITQKKIDLNLSLSLTSILAGLVCLLFEPSWVNSLSFQMSWLIQLILMLTQHQFHQKKSIFAALAVYLFLIPTYNILGFPSLISILISFVLSGFVEFILFPLSFLSYFNKLVAQFFDLICNHFITALQGFETYTTITSAHQQIITNLNWFIICVLHIYISTRTTQNRRALEIIK